MMNSAEKTLGTYKKKSVNKNENEYHKPWLNNECKKARKNFRKSQRNYRYRKTPEAKLDMSIEAKKLCN